MQKTFSFEDLLFNDDSEDIYESLFEELKKEIESTLSHVTPKSGLQIRQGKHVILCENVLAKIKTLKGENDKIFMEKTSELFQLLSGLINDLSKMRDSKNDKLISTLKETLNAHIVKLNPTIANPNGGLGRC